MEISIKTQRHEARMERMKAIATKGRPARVRVVPKNDELRKVLKHPSGIGFRSEGSVEWPLDSFTRRRVNDGDVTIEEPQPPQEKSARHQQHQRRGTSEE